MTEVTTRFKVPRVRSRRHLDWVATLCCAVPGCPIAHRDTVVPHHLTCGPEPKARGLKASDIWTVPLCYRHHGPGVAGSLHERGDERAWWADKGLDPIVMASWLAFLSMRQGRLAA